MDDLEKSGKDDCWNYHRGDSHCVFVVCRLGKLAHAMKKSEDLYDVI